MVGSGGRDFGSPAACFQSVTRDGSCLMLVLISSARGGAAVANQGCCEWVTWPGHSGYN